MKKRSGPSRMPEADLAERLRGNARKITGPRKAILNILSQQAHPLTIKEIYGLLPPGECDLATVYRSLKMLEEMNLAKRFDFGDGTARYELVHGKEEQHHHHHLICTECARVVELDQCFPEELEERIARGNGFVAVFHRLEFFGICPACQSR